MPCAGRAAASTPLTAARGEKALLPLEAALLPRGAQEVERLGAALSFSGMSRQHCAGGRVIEFCVCGIFRVRLLCCGVLFVALDGGCALSFSAWALVWCGVMIVG